MRVSAGVLCLASNGDWCSGSLKNYLKLESSRIKLVAWTDVNLFADQLMTPYLSGGSTINGTPGGDRGREFLVGRLTDCRSPFT